MERSLVTGLRQWAIWIATLVAAAVFAGAGHATGATYEVLHVMNTHDGTSVRGALVIGADSAYYGTAGLGGANGKGTVFRLQSDGKFKVLHDFRGGADDGSGPRGLVRGPDGNLYGVTEYGGISDLGTAFRVDAEGKVTLLSSFAGSVGHPTDPLVAASDGQLYGNSFAGYGTIFRITTQGEVTVLHAFQRGKHDGSNAYGRLIEGGDGFLYGTTLAGGEYRCGTVFRMNRSDGAITLLHEFQQDGRSTHGPGDGVTEGPDGWFYGVIGARIGKNVDYRRGQIFRVKADGQFEVVYDFPSPRRHGANPGAPLLLGRDGQFYGTTGLNSNTDGTAFRLPPGGGLETLHRFDRASGDGYDPDTELVEVDDGEFIGATFYGGQANRGVIFRMRVPDAVVAPTAR